MAAVGTGFGLMSGAWMFTAHSWNPEWLGWLNFPGMFLAGWAFLLTGCSETVAYVLLPVGIGFQWSLLGAVAGFASHWIHKHNQRAK